VRVTPIHTCACVYTAAVTRAHVRVSIERAVKNYKAVTVHFTSQGWGGLERRASSPALLDGTVNHDNWCVRTTLTAAATMYTGARRAPCVDCDGRV
jgi:hypothetical protein